jgi:hypothetical protein
MAYQDAPAYAEPLAGRQEDLIISPPLKVRQFAAFFKGYMNLAALAVAALPVPATILGLIPTYAVQTRSLSVYATLFCLLVLGYAFYIRGGLARAMLRDNLTYRLRTRKAQLEAERDAITLGRELDQLNDHDRARVLNIATGLRDVDREIRIVSANAVVSALANAAPFVLIVASFGLIIQYHRTLEDSINMSAVLHQSVCAAQLTTQCLMGVEQTPPLNLMLFASYIGIFASAEAAFALMAIKEYLQDLLGLSDPDIIRKSERAAEAAA